MKLVKSLGKRLLCTILEKQVKNLRQKHNFAIVAVAGSVGKTSTKLAVAQVLGSVKRVRYQTGNYNDRLTVPLVIFGHDNPPLFSLSRWWAIFLSNKKQIRGDYPFDVVVVELGTDAPGQIAEFAYLKPDLAIVTATTDEHMEFFKTLDAVAIEELTVCRYAKNILLNSDDIPANYRQSIKYYRRYGIDDADYTIAAEPKIGTRKASIHYPEGTVPAVLQLLGDQGAKVALAAFAAAHMLEIDTKTVLSEIARLQAFAGRMNTLNGKKDSTIIDDTYNASPAAVKAALDVIYKAQGSQKIAVLGMMNELGATSEQAHAEIGAYCDPEQLDLVVTIGADARKFTAMAAEAKGCSVASFDSPYEAGDYVLNQLKDNAIILAKGSQNRVFAEESLKVLLADPIDEPRLVRQSAYWMNIKKSQFGER